MKIGVVHDWLVTNAGAEKVLKAILDIYPGTDVFSLVDIIKISKKSKKYYIEDPEFLNNYISFRYYYLTLAVLNLKSHLQIQTSQTANFSS